MLIEEELSFLQARVWQESLGNCQNTKCARPRAEFPMAFRSDPYCSDNCRKAIGMDLPK